MIKESLSKKELADLVEKYNNLIPEKFASNEFPEKFELRPVDWALTDETINKRVDEKSLLTMDVEFLSNEIINSVLADKVDLVKNYPCGLRCPGCFSEESIYGDKYKLMKWQDVFSTIDDAIKLGLKSIKFLGPGELFQNSDLFNILDAAKDRNLPISIFTKGAELGDDTLARRIYFSHGITNASELVARLAEYDNVRILLGFNSFSSERQDWMVGSLKSSTNYIFKNGLFSNRGISDYTKKRDKALVNLTAAGFNEDEQKLSLIAAPVFYQQIDEIASMYLWAAKRNIPLIIAPTMESGYKAKGLQKANKKLDPYHEKLVDLMLSVYETAIENGIANIDKIKKEGVSAYMGTAPCNQVANGLMIRLNGQISMCPGSNEGYAIYGNIHDESLENIWKKSANYKMGALTNNWCQAKKQGMPKLVQKTVMKILNSKYEKS